jgi:hypothetical protein
VNFFQRKESGILFVLSFFGFQKWRQFHFFERTRMEDERGGKNGKAGPTHQTSAGSSPGPASSALVMSSLEDDDAILPKSICRQQSDGDAASVAKKRMIVCHELPCKMNHVVPGQDFTRKRPKINPVFIQAAPVDTYFVPQRLDLPQNKASVGEGDCSNYYAAQFRGRGLMSQTRELLSEENIAPCWTHGRVFQAVPSKDSSLTIQSEYALKTKASFEKYYSWEHAHDLCSASRRSSRGSVGSRLETAQEWIQVASSLHCPLPVNADCAN